jgi:hypothetical protein
VTYHRDVRPILDRHCVGCHTPGGIGPIDLTWREEEWAQGPPPWTAVAAAAVADGRMPPWMPDESCHPVAGSRALSSRQEERIAAWAAGGFALGDEADWPGPPDPVGVDTLGEPDARLAMPEAYTPDRASPDDYRCFVVDPGLDTTTWLRAFDVEPDTVEVVHHVLLYRLDPSWADEVATWDAADEGPGYSCFGSPGTWEAETLAGWAPGQQPEVYGAGIARRLAEGSVLVLQLHYNTVNLGPDDPVPADRSGIALWTLAEGEVPIYELLSLPLAKTDLAIPAGDADVTEVEETELSTALPPGRNVPIRGAFPHMHRLGRSVRVDVLREDGSEACVIDVPRWDFDGQQTYFFPADAPVFVSDDDTLRITCRYDNSPANQIVVNGEPVEVRDVGWGEGTFDEMCLAYLYVTLPVAR